MIWWAAVKAAIPDRRPIAPGTGGAWVEGVILDSTGGSHPVVARLRYDPFGTAYALDCWHHPDGAIAVCLDGWELQVPWRHADRGAALRRCRMPEG